MINQQELEEAGFTPAQAKILGRMQRQTEDTSIQQFGLLQAAINTGFARVEQQIERQIASLTAAMNEGFSQVNARLDRIETHFQAPPEAT